MMSQGTVIMATIVLIINFLLLSILHTKFEVFNI